jgi:hypothetical protein
VEYCALGWRKPVYVLEDPREWLIYVGPKPAYIVLVKVYSSWVYIDSNRRLSWIVGNLITALHCSKSMEHGYLWIRNEKRCDA